MLISLLDHDFQEENAMEGCYVKGQTSVMASKRSSLVLHIIFIILMIVNDLNLSVAFRGVSGLIS
jgi:hypothetical protein